MLVVQREINESIYIGTDGKFPIKITVVRAANGKIRLGIDAPDEFKIVREELLPPDLQAALERSGEAA